MPPPAPCPDPTNTPIHNHLTPELQHAMEKWLTDRIKVTSSNCVCVCAYAARYELLHLSILNSILCLWMWIRSRMQSGSAAVEAAQTVDVPWLIKWLTLPWRLKVRNVWIKIKLFLLKFSVCMCVFAVFAPKKTLFKYWVIGCLIYLPVDLSSVIILNDIHASCHQSSANFYNI